MELYHLRFHSYKNQFIAENEKEKKNERGRETISA